MNSFVVAMVGGTTLFRQGLVRLLPADFHVAAQETELDAASLARLETVAPVLVLMDSDIGSAPRIIATLRMALPGVKVVFLTDGCDAERLRAVLEAGADGYQTLNRSVEALAQALRLVLLGEKVFPSDLGAMMEDSHPNAPVGAHGISRRETQILRFVTAGETNKSIGRHLAITEATVKIHLKSLLRKINVSNRTQAAVWGLSNGLTAHAAS